MKTFTTNFIVLLTPGYNLPFTLFRDLTINPTLLYFINSIVLMLLTLNSINFINLFFYNTIKYLTLGFLFYIFLALILIINILIRLSSISSNLKSSIKVDNILREKFITRYLALFAANFKMSAVLFINIFNELNNNSLSIQLFILITIFILFFSYFLTTALVVNNLFKVWISIKKLDNAIDEAISSWSIDSTSKMENEDIVSDITTDSLIDELFSINNINNTYNQEIKGTSSTDTLDSGIKVEVKPSLANNDRIKAYINKINIGILRTNGLIPKKGLIFNSTPYRKFTTSTIILKNDLINFNNIPSPNTGNKKAIVINPGSKIKNSIFKDFKTYIAQEKYISKENLLFATLSAIDEFEKDILKKLFDKNGAVSIQMVLNTPPTENYPKGKWTSLTSFYTITKDNIGEWKLTLAFKMNLFTQLYNSSLKKGKEAITLAFKYKPITQNDGTLAALGYLWSPTVFSEIYKGMDNGANREGHKYSDFYLTLWGKLIPTVWNWENLSGVKIIKPTPTNKFYVENVMIRNPFKDVINGTIKLTPDIVNDLSLEFEKVSRVNKNLFKENPDFLKLTIQIRDNDEGLRECFVFYNELLITKFIDKTLGQYIAPNGLVEAFDRYFLNGTSLRIEENAIKYITQSIKPNKKDVFMDNTPKAYWKNIINTEFATYDFETRSTTVQSYGVDTQKLDVISYGIYHNTMWTDSNTPTNKFQAIDDTLNTQDLLLLNFLKAIKNLAENSLNKTDKYRERVYYLFAHNAARFDEVFLIKTLIDNAGKNDQINIIKKDGIMISVDWIVNGKLSSENHNEKITRIRFLDSYLMLPSALSKLCKAFNVESKGTLNVKDFNENTDIKAILPQLREYNLKDCRILWDILYIHAKNTAIKFNVDIFTCPTASSLAFKVFRTLYLKPEEHQINITDQDLYKNLHDAYHGGASDVYTPFNVNSELIYYYDVNSEYPSMMAKNVMPTGNAIKIIGDVEWQDPSFCGFVTADIECPNDITVPLLSVKVAGKTITGAGSWRGIYFAAELREALTLGYKVNCVEAIKFEGKLVFNDFINDIYNERQKYSKSNPMNMICKLIMNSTYGRFGMSPFLTKVRILDIQDYYDYEPNTEFVEIIEISETKVMVVTKESRNEELISKNPNKNLQISLPIAAAVTSYGRIHIHRIKMMAASLGILMYSDTDSVVCTKELPSHLVGSKLGQLKLEYIIEKAIFISSKFYILKGIRDGKSGDLIKDSNGDIVNEIIKAKGVKDNSLLSYETFENLLFLDSKFKTTQDKWFRDPIASSIYIKRLSNTLGLTTGKRVIVTDIYNKFYKTFNVIFDNGEIVSNDIEKIGLPIVGITYLPILRVIPSSNLPMIFKTQSIILPPIIIIHPIALVVYSGGNPLIEFKGNPIIKYKPIVLSLISPIIYTPERGWLPLLDTRTRPVIYMYPPGSTIISFTRVKYWSRVPNKPGLIGSYKNGFRGCNISYLPETWPNLK